AGTVYEEGVFVLIAYGVVLGMMGAIAYWGPKLWGRTMADKQVAPLLALGLLAAVLASAPYLIAGFADQPADTATFSYGGPQNLWNLLSGIGHGLMVLTVLAFVGLALRSFKVGPAAGDDPVDGLTLEWA
ncbi:MAG TPA: hypothetical protein PLV68_02145, partial [Ilumatobacteraceae bacterium]|nr:hypothetical protein [Ilumatobacteraceae bacterium]